MEKKNIRTMIDDVDICHFTGNIDKVVEYLLSWKVYYHDIYSSITIETNGYGCSECGRDGELRIYGERIETDEECIKRLDKEQRLIEREQKKDQAKLKKLIKEREALEKEISTREKKVLKATIRG